MLKLQEPDRYLQLILDFRGRDTAQYNYSGPILFDKAE
jgi:hypothetical protein